MRRGALVGLRIYQIYRFSIRAARGSGSGIGGGNGSAGWRVAGDTSCRADTAGRLLSLMEGEDWPGELMGMDFSGNRETARAAEKGVVKCAARKGGFQAIDKFACR